MSSLPGGAANKLGNRYEAWWTLQRVAGLLAGRASTMRLEPPGEAGAGVEFWIDEPAGRWFEQVKNSAGRWTVQRLLAEGVLPAAGVHLAGGHRFRFISASGAPQLEVLSSRARSASSLEEYGQLLTSEQRPLFERLADAWGISEEAAFGYLQRVWVEHLPEQSARRQVHLAFELLVQEDPEVVVNELRGWLDEQLHQTVTAPTVWSHLAGKGFRRRLLAGDETTSRALAGTVLRHQRRVADLRPALGVVSQPHVADLVELVTSGSSQVMVLHGRAGSGKSTVAATAVQQLSSAGWHAAAVRMDATNFSVQTAAALGRAFDLEGSPAALLSAVADGSPAVLLVDQLDAVSDYSGRMPDSYDAVTDLLEQTERVPNLRVVLVVRTVDLRADPRMQSVLADRPRVVAVEVGDLEPEDVSRALTQAGIDPYVLSPATLQLLRVPLHFAVFSRLPIERQQAPFRTLPELYDRFTEQIRGRVQRQVGHLDWSRTVGVLVYSMSKRELLDAPAAVLDSADPAEVAALVSAGVLVNDGGRYAFFHETYFDYLFARSFVADNRDLHTFLVASGQQLFRRAQTRQVLDYLAGTDRPAYRQAVLDVLTASDVRPHLQAVVLTSMSALLDASAQDWLAVEELAFGSRPLQTRLQELLATPAWFDAADTAGRWEALLADPATAEEAAFQLARAAHHRAERAAELVRPHIGSSPAWRLRLRNLFEMSLTPGLVDLSVELIEGGHLDDARSRIAVNTDFWSTMHLLQHEDAAGSVRLIGAYLRRALAQAEADGAADPFDADNLARSTSGGASMITAVAKAEPQAFVDEVLPFVVQVAERTASEAEPGALRTSRRWGHRYTGSPSEIDEAVFAGLTNALRHIARDQPETALAIVRPLGDSGIADLRFIFCRTLSAAATARSADVAADWLLNDDRNLELGWATSRMWASRELVDTASRLCSQDRLDALTATILTWFPWWERTIRGLPFRGRSQQTLLAAIDPSRAGREVGRRIAELERKLGNPPGPPEPLVMASIVQPPLPKAAAQHMSDQNWIKAIEKHRTDDGDWLTGGSTGGASELAQLLGQQAKLEPQRFAWLALTFSATTPPQHVIQVVTAVAGKIPIPLLTRLCAHARGVAGQLSGRAVCSAVATVAAEADQGLVELVIDCARDDDPGSELTPGSASDFESEERTYGDLMSAGHNCTRGAAARALAAILFEQRQLGDQLAPTIRALACDPSLAVRTQAAEAVGALSNIRPELASDIADALFDAPSELLEARTCRELLTYMLNRWPDRFARHLAGALVSSDAAADNAGWVWAVAHVNEVLNPPAPTELAGLPASARKGAAAAFASKPDVAPDQLALLMQDPDPAVREAAAFCLRRIDTCSQAAAHQLIDAFLQSPAFTAHFDGLIDALEQTTSLLPVTATLTICERVVETARNGVADLRMKRLEITPNLVQVVLRLYRQGGPAHRTRCLDLIDKLTVIGSYGLEDALARER